MITKKRIVELLENATISGRDPINAMQYALEELASEYPSGIEDKAQILNAIIFFANGLFQPEEAYGYKAFDLILSRTFPNSETLRYIEEQEGKNIFNEEC